MRATGMRKREPSGDGSERRPAGGRHRRAALAAGTALAATALLAFACPRVEAPREGPGLRAAACKRKVTPVVGENHSDPIYMAGFGNDRPATGVHDDLWARGVVLDSGEKRIALVTLDFVGYFHNEVETIRSLVDPSLGFDSITVTSTHNHEGPDTMGLWGPNELTAGVDLGYLDFVNQQVADCIEEAASKLEPSAIKFATGSTMGASLEPWPDLVADGRVLEELTIELTEADGGGTIEVEGDPGPILNPSVPSFQLRQRVPAAERARDFFEWLVGGGWLFGAERFPDLRPLREVQATLVNYASHPEALGSDNTLITSDFPHFMREALEERYGGVAIYMSADLGVLQGPLDVDVPDAETGEPVPRRTFAFAERMGELLADRAARALSRVHRWNGAPTIEVRRVEPVVLEVENPFFQALGQIGVFGRRELLQQNGTFVLETEVQALRVGDANIAVTPNELDPQIGNDYRALMTKAEHRFVAGLGNDEIGYQMPEAKFNPSCFLCFEEVFAGNEEACPYLETLDCDTIFINNLGPGADPALQGHMKRMLGELNR